MNNITNVISVIGFSSMIPGFIYVGRKLQILDDLKITVDKIKVEFEDRDGFYDQEIHRFRSYGDFGGIIAATLGLYIRDAYLVEHPEITQ